MMCSFSMDSYDANTSQTFCDDNEAQCKSSLQEEKDQDSETNATEVIESNPCEFIQEKEKKGCTHSTDGKNCSFCQLLDASEEEYNKVNSKSK
mmetsp:Transcript_49856/g.60252  ORF Transcript_49856/g.60252 Transcript_49856/m.60252 type:complete len:93 (+) Transcript_49856:652-930(+)